MHVHAALTRQFGMRLNRQRTRTVGVRVTSDEHVRILESAKRMGKDPSEYVRDCLLGAEADVAQICLSEIREMRTILFELIYAMFRGREIDSELLQEIVKAAEAKRHSIVKTRLPN